MSHYEARLEQDLAELRRGIEAIGDAVANAIERSCRALMAFDRAEAADVIVGDMPINRQVREFDRRVHLFVARHLPSAGVLRLISSMLRLTVALERIGDYAATIGRETAQLTRDVPTSVARDVELMSEQSVHMLRQSMRAFVDGNPELARGTKGMAAQIDSSFERVYADLLTEGENQSRPLSDLFELLMVFNRLERVSDQAKNICEETIFAVTGETKEPKVYRILFVDRSNGCWSVLAETVARRAYPNSGRYGSAGWDPAKRFEPAFEAFLDAKGLPRPETGPRALPNTRDELDDNHLIVSLEPGLREHLAVLPFKTVLLEWNPGFGSGVTDESVEEGFRDLTIRVRDLMQRLRGAGAD